MAMLLVVGCRHTESVRREMSWSEESQVNGMRTLPEGAVRMTFVQSPKFHVGLVIPGLKQRLEASGKRQVSVDFEIQCYRRHFDVIRVSSVDGTAIKTRADNMWLESANVISGKDLGPFRFACSY